MADAVDAILDQWHREKPEFSEQLWPMAVIGRVQRLTRLLEREVATFFAERDLQHWEADVLLTLRRAPGPITAGALLRSAMVTSGAITNRIDRLEARGLVERVRDTEDRRSVLIRLTPQGRDLMDELFAAHLANEARLLQGIPPESREPLATILRAALEHLGDTELG